ncbi:MAG TPA: HNH endonuclease [Blastocatellia bacterium]|nr:HNH endonuclease [Blastocatellia bacterium]HMV82796.1 HNH endonuclease [Blastocatellia bacterium]HMX27427.1 HNH endonuclease [Blastocatellia bacterium]HMY74014.1 HNH endonuclease [Blastocatellia bacterium]HMZ23096.1 HNH endonuclease [Blastocatellia bacterium]
MPRKHITVAKQRVVIERAQGLCEYCRSRADHTTESFAIEHILPLSRNGNSELNNLAFSCSGCNGHKHRKIEAPDPVSGLVVPLFHPRRQKWEEHFRWSDDYKTIIGLTPTGRATVEALNMNRPGLVNIREALFQTRKHPLQ